MILAEKDITRQSIFQLLLELNSVLKLFCKFTYNLFTLYSAFLKESEIFLKIRLMAAKKGYLSCLDTVKPVRDALEVFNGKWKLSIIISVSAGNERFTDIQESIPGITPKVL